MNIWGFINTKEVKQWIKEDIEQYGSVSGDPTVAPSIVTRSKEFLEKVPKLSLISGAQASEKQPSENKQKAIDTLLNKKKGDKSNNVTPKPDDVTPKPKTLEESMSDLAGTSGIDPYAPVKSTDISIVKTILSDTKKRNKELEKQAKELLSKQTPEEVKNRFGSIKKQTDTFFTELQKTQDKNLQTFLSKIEKLNTPTDLPGMLFYIGVAGASDPDGFFSGAAKGLKKWSDANIKDKKERKQFEKDLAKYEFQASKDILATVKEGKLAGLNLSKEEQEAISKLPKEKLAILQILSQSRAGVDKVKLELAKLMKKKSYLDLGKGQQREKIIDQLADIPIVKKVLGSKYRDTIRNDPRFQNLFNQLARGVKKDAARLAVKKGREDVPSGITETLEGDVLNNLIRNPKFSEILERELITIGSSKKR